MELQVKRVKGRFGGRSHQLPPCSSSSSSRLHSHGVRGQKSHHLGSLSRPGQSYEKTSKLVGNNILCPGRCAQLHYWGKAAPTPDPTHHSTGQTMNPKSQAHPFMVCSAHTAPMRNCDHHLSLYVLLASRPPSLPSTWCKYVCMYVWM